MERKQQKHDERLEEYSRALTEFFDRLNSWEQSVVSDTGVSLAQMHLIEVIGNRGRMRMKELAQLLGVTTGTLTVMVHRLAERDYLIRLKDEQDRRSYFVDLSEKGKAEYHHHHHMHFHLVEGIVHTLGERESEQFFAHLKKLQDALIIGVLNE
ncbi:MAG TPA: MarR family transcriptional regulator [Sediminispirochaeta sp.]|nr:MarR family transcriptional regulator [Sediminispirochaeta sp.]